MAENSKIEWCDHTFNPWRGCTKVSPGCANCYAETLSHRNPAVLGVWGKGKPRILASSTMWNWPLKLERIAAKHQSVMNGTAERPRVFCASLADWLDDKVPIEWLARLLRLIHDTPHLDWLLLTKRPENWRPRMESVHTVIGSDRASACVAAWLENCPAFSNVWIGTSVEDQQRADERIPQLLNIPAHVRFLSCEPLLGPLELMLGRNGHTLQRTIGQDIHWVIAGGESGKDARPMHPDWARSLRDQCQAAKVPFLFKQWGAWVYPSYADPQCSFDDYPKAERGEVWTPWKDRGRKGYDLLKLGKKRAGRLLDGETWDQFPQPTAERRCHE